MREKLSIDLNVSSEFPKTFIWACNDDELVPSSNAKRMHAALQKEGADSELHIYPTGGHGIAGGRGTSAEGWLDSLIKYMKNC